MGTPCGLQFLCEHEARARDFKREALAWLAAFEARYSRFRPDSLVSLLNDNAGGEAVALEERDLELLALCDWYHWLTRGTFDPTTLPLQRLWDHHRPQQRLPSDAEVQAARALVDWRSVERTETSLRLPRPGMALDFGGIGKEYAVDRVSAIAREFAITSVLVDFGQDVRVAGSPPEGGKWRIGLEHPDDTGRCWGGVAVTDRAVCTSGNYRRFVEIDGRRYGHIVDPRTGWPVSHDTLSATVIAPACTEAGILSTASFILGGEEGLRLVEAAPQASGALWIKGSATVTRGFLDHVYTD
jgi:thiamine biosynthesis lipoprotein